MRDCLSRVCGWAIALLEIKGVWIIAGGPVLALGTPSMSSVAMLAGFVAIRTFLSFALEVEIDGQPPMSKVTHDQDMTGSR